jgi:hypothetical protein
MSLERLKAKLTALSVFVTAASILGSVGIAAFTFHQSEKLQKETADTQFALKAADIVLQSDDPEVNANKAARFQNLFPGRVSTDWSDFDWKKYAEESDDMKLQLAKLLVERPSQCKQIIAMYRTLFQSDPTVQAFLNRLEGIPTSPGTTAVKGCSQLAVSIDGKTR